MLDIFLRACRNPMDYGRVVKCQKLKFFAKKHLGDDCYEFTFSCIEPFMWKAGQHAIFRLPGQNVKGKTWRVFSIASAPHEGVIKIATIISDEPSDFKKKLATLEEGSPVEIHGPIGEFYLKPNINQVVGIAGGIGITPFRSILSDIANGAHKDTKIELIYAGKNNFWAFEEEVKNWTQMGNVTVHFVNTPDEVNEKLNNLVNVYHNQANYFVSGSPGMINALTKSLKEKGIKKVVSDPFKGY